MDLLICSVMSQTSNIASINIFYAFPGVHTHFDPVVVLERLTTTALDKRVVKSPKLTIKKPKVYAKPKFKRKTKNTKSPQLAEKLDDLSSELDEEETPLKYLKLRGKNGRYSLILFNTKNLIKIKCK